MAPSSGRGRLSKRPFILGLAEDEDDYLRLFRYSDQSDRPWMGSSSQGKQGWPMSPSLPINKLLLALKRNTLVRIFEEIDETYSDSHLKDLVVDEVGPGREILVRGRWVINFGSDSFLGLDRDPRVIQAICQGVKRWGTHNGTSRAFASVRSNTHAEERLAAWLGVEVAR